jgi:oxepin-CoA hydrolase/3-oxo-5,6-dehydrosuberyl-CoA semialdehyde dehydrogenase
MRFRLARPFTPLRVRSRWPILSILPSLPVIGFTRIWMLRRPRANPFFPDRVAHGYLLLSFAAGLFVEPSPGPVLANTGLNALSFQKPVVAGDCISVQLTVKRKTRRTEAYGEVRWHVALRNQDRDLVAEYELLTMNSYGETKGA